MLPDPTTTLEQPASPPADDAAATPPPAADAAPASETPDTPAEEKVSPFAKGVAEAVEDGVAPKPKVEEEEGKEDSAAADDGKPAVAAKPGDKPAAEKTVEDEIAEALAGMKPRTAERFQKLLAKRDEEVAPLRDAAQRHQAWQEIITDTQASTEQLSSALGYLKAINSGEPETMGKAFDAMLAEVQWLGKKLGREVPGFVDPIADHKDLVDAVDSGEMTRKYALEIAQSRTTGARRTELTAAQQQQQQREQQQTDAVNRAINVDVAAVNAHFRKIDPMFEQKIADKQFIAAVDLIRESLPPQQWAAAVVRAYEAIPADRYKPAPAKPAPTNPMRPGTNGAGMTRQFKDGATAFRAGVAEAT